MAGRSVRCRACKAVFQVPTFTQTAPAWILQPTNPASPLADPDADAPRPMSTPAMAMGVTLFHGMAGLVRVAVIQVVN